MTARAIMQLIPAPGRISGGQVYVGDDPNPATAASAKRWRGTTVAMITQDPLSSLNPLVRIGVQITEMLRYHGHLSRAEARTRAVELLKAVGLPNPAPHHAPVPERAIGRHASARGSRHSH